MRYIARDYVEQMLDDNSALDLLKLAKPTAREALQAHAETINEDEYTAFSNFTSFEESLDAYKKWIEKTSDEKLKAFVLPVHGIDDLT
jgi:hypothetical protein